MAKAILVSFSIYRVSHMDLSTLQPNLKLKTEPNHISYHKNDGINWLTLYNMSHPYETPCIMSKIKKDTYSLCITTFLLDFFLFMSKKKIFFFAELVICSPKLNKHYFCSVYPYSQAGRSHIYNMYIVVGSMYTNYLVLTFRDQPKTVEKMGVLFVIL